MLAALSAASSALDALQALTSSKKTNASSQVTTGLTQNGTTNFDVASLTTQSNTSTSTSSAPGTLQAPPQSGSLSPATFSALLNAQGQASGTSATSQSDSLKDLFAQLDSDGNGQISKSEFEDKLGAGGTNTANADAVFAKLDKDGDGKVSLDELSAALKGKGKHHHAAKPPGGGETTDPLLKVLDEANEASAASRQASASYALTDQALQRVAQTKVAASASTVSISA